MRIAIDAMGGDHAPGEIVAGAIEGLQFLGSGDECVLIGREDTIRPHLSPNGDGRIRVEHCTQVIEMDDVPVEALRQKKDSSIMKMAVMAADKRVDAVISAGNTGACVAACQLRMRTLPGVSRPGIAVVLPSFHGPVTICDVGANVEPKPHHLLEYAVMAAIYAETILGIRNPRVGLISIGSEEVKGKQQTKLVRELIRNETRLNFVG